MQDSKENIYPTEFEPESVTYARLSREYAKDIFDKKALLLVEGAARNALNLANKQSARASARLKDFYAKQAKDLSFFKAGALDDVIASKVKADTRLKKAAATAHALVSRQNF